LNILEKIKSYLSPTIKEKSCNEELNIKDIRNNFLYTKDNKIMCYIKIQPLNLYLLSGKEQEQIIKQLSAELSSETKEMKFFSIARPVDVGDLLDDLQQKANNSLDQIQKALLKKHINETVRLTFTGEAVERQNFLILWQDYNDYAEKDLLKRAMELINKFANCSIKAEILEEQYIIQLCSGFTNMSFAFKESSEYDDYMPTLARNGG
jgi:CxxC motif-containing protein